MCFPRASGMESRIVQRGLQFVDASFCGQNGGFYPFQFALLLESQLTGPCRFARSDRLHFSVWGFSEVCPDRLAGGIPLFFLLQVIRKITRLDEQAAVLES